MNTKPFFFLIIAAKLSVNIFSSRFKDALCSQFIGEFPDYNCTSEEPTSLTNSSVTFLIHTLKEQKFTIKVRDLQQDPSRIINDLTYIEGLTDPHKFISLVSFKERDSFLFEIFEGDISHRLDSLLRDSTNSFSNPRAALTFFYSLTKALEYLNSKDIVHASIHPQNIAVTKEMSPLLMGFENAMALNSEAILEGDIHYMAPEALVNHPYPTRVDNKIDIYSLGIVLFLMNQNRYPFEAGTYDEIKKLHRKQIYKFQTPTTFDIANIIHSCLMLDPAKRPSPLELKEMVKQALETQDPQISTSALEVSNFSELNFDSNFIVKKAGFDALDPSTKRIFYSLIAFFVIPLSLWTILRHVKAVKAESQIEDSQQEIEIQIS
jgi:serine/threonine protein kinase